MTTNHCRPLCFLAVILALAIVPHAASAQSLPTVHKTTLGEMAQATPEVSTEEVVRILASGSEPLLDVRSPEEFAIAHIPGSINLYEKEVELVRQRYPDKATRLVFYCNGPFCGKSKRLSEQLVVLGYTHVRRYQLGLPVWRALGHTVQTDLGGFRYIYQGQRRRTKTAACRTKIRARASSSSPTQRTRHGRLQRKLPARRTGTVAISVERSQT